MVSISSLIFRLCNGCMLCDFLAWCVHRECLLVLEARILGWVGGERLEEKVFTIHWGCNQTGKGDHSRFPDPELGMRLQKLDSRSTGRGVCLPSAYFVALGRAALGLAEGACWS